MKPRKLVWEQVDPEVFELECWFPDVSDAVMREVRVYPIKAEDFVDWAKEQKEKAQ